MQIHRGFQLRPFGRYGIAAALLLFALVAGAPALAASDAVVSESTGETGDAPPDLEAVAPVDAHSDEYEDAYSDEYDDEFGDDGYDEPSSFPDPFETPNRMVLKVNQSVDTFILDPITQVYRFILPEMARRSISRFFDNVNSPQVLINDMLQLEWQDAGITMARLLVNSTAGLGGLFDPAEKFGMPGHRSDFGQTLAIAGAESGPYFVIPLLGPSNVRDGIGLGVDAFLQPTVFILGGTNLILFGGSAGLSSRAKHFEELKALEESSIDYYAALRSGYYQNRVAEIWSRREDRRPSSEEPEAAPDGAVSGEAEVEPDSLAVVD
jgi:phospholipid-binding lipoprotein MlaA